MGWSIGAAVKRWLGTPEGDDEPETWKIAIERNQRRMAVEDNVTEFPTSP